MGASKATKIVRMAALVGFVFFGGLTAWSVRDYTTCASLDCAGAAIGIVLFGSLTLGCTAPVITWAAESRRRTKR